MPAALGRFRLGAISILAIAGGLYLWVESAVVSDVPLTKGGAAIMTVLTQSHFGSAWTFGLIGVMFASLAGTRQTRTALWLGTAGAVVYAAGKAAMTHAADAGDLSLAAAIYLAHYCATALWVGSVIVTACLLCRWPITTSDTPMRRVAFYKQLSCLATVALGAVIATGIGIAEPNIAPLTASLFAAPYGRVLILKLAFVTLAVILGGCNRMIYLPRMNAAAAKDDAAFRCARQVFERTITIEAFVLAAVLLLASVLGHTSPPAG